MTSYVLAIYHDCLSDDDLAEMTNLCPELKFEK